MGATRTKGLSPAFGGLDSQHRLHNQSIGDEDECHGDEEEEHADEEEFGLVGGRVHARQPEQRRDFTEEVVHFPAAAAGHLQGQGGLQDGVAEATNPGRGGQLQAEPRAHDHRVMERATNGYEPVEGHDGQQEALGGTQGQEDEKLGHAAPITNHLPGAAYVYKHLWDRACGEAEVQEGEVGEEEIHGRVEFGVQT